MTAPEDGKKEDQDSSDEPLPATEVKSGLVERTEIATVEKEMTSLDLQLATYLGEMGLPTKSILVTIQERKRLFSNLPEIVAKIDPGRRTEAVYLSKFAYAGAAGLFDAALSYLWDAVVANLRSRILRFDLEYFYDVAIKDPDERRKYRSPEDLQKFGDWDLIGGCREVGLISDVGYKHLDYIRDMRNWASAAHPNQTEISGLNLASWLETCVAQVLSAPLDSPHFQLKRLLANLRSRKLDEADAQPIAATIGSLPQELIHTLLAAIFGIYVDTDTSAEARQNIDLISVEVWRRSEDEARRDLGVRYAKLSVNADLPRKELAKAFLAKVGGLAYLTEELLAVEFKEAIDELRRAHFAYYNFYNEPPYAAKLLRLVPKSGAIPKAIVRQYVRAVVLCRIGNSYGVSLAAVPSYDEMIGVFRDQEAREFILSPQDRDVGNALSGNRVERFKKIANGLAARTNDLVLKRALSRLASGTAKSYSDGVVQRETTDMLGAS